MEVSRNGSVIFYYKESQHEVCYKVIGIGALIKFTFNVGVNDFFNFLPSFVSLKFCSSKQTFYWGIEGDFVYEEHNLKAILAEALFSGSLIDQKTNYGE